MRRMARQPDVNLEPPPVGPPSQIDAGLEPIARLVDDFENRRACEYLATTESSCGS
jgi:hypothetical protein